MSSESTDDAEEHLRQALLTEDLEVVTLILQENPQLANQNLRCQKLSPLCDALMRCFTTQNTDMVKLLLDLGADLSLCNRQYLDLTSESPLVTAAKIGTDHYPILEILLEREKVDHDLESRLSYTALYLAAKRGDIELARILVNKGHDVNWLCDGLNTALHAAAGEGHAHVMRFLLDNGAEVIPNDTKTLPLHAAIRGGHRTAVEILVDHGCNIDEVNSSMFSPLMMACACDYTDIVQYLLEKGADVNISRTSSPFHSTPLSIAAFHGKSDIMCLLLQHGADVNGKNDWMVSPLHIAAEQLDNLETVKVLIENGANLNILDSWNRSPLVCAVLHAAEETVSLLIKHGADVRKQSVYHPLHCAYITKDVGIRTLRGLLLAGCYTSKDRFWFDLNKLDTDLNTISEEFENNIIGEGEFEERRLKCNWLKKYLTTPLSLQNICRMEIRKRLIMCSGGRDITPMVTRLPTTLPVISHLCFET